MNVTWSAKALKDLDNIYEFLVWKSKPAAINLIESIRARVPQLLDFPYSGVKFSTEKKMGKEYRYLVEGNCKIYYSTSKNTITIEAVFDTRQDPAKLKL